MQVSDNPVVTLNHAAAAAMVHGPQALDALESDDRIAGDHRLPAVRAHLLETAGEHRAAGEAYRVAAHRTTNLPQQRYLNARAARLIDD